MKNIGNVAFNITLIAGFWLIDKVKDIKSEFMSWAGQ